MSHMVYTTYDRTMGYAILASQTTVSHLATSQDLQTCQGHKRQRKTKGLDPDWGRLRRHESICDPGSDSELEKGHWLEHL